MNPDDNSRKKLLTALAIFLAIVIIVGATVVAKQNKSSDTASQAKGSSSSTSQPTDKSTPSEDPGTTSEGNSTYKDGTYSADSTYQSPGGTEKISVRVTIADGVVTDSSVTTNSSSREAVEYQSMFKENYTAQVEGKPMDSISLSRVSGSSLTSQGFNSALDEIKDQAKA